MRLRTLMAAGTITTVMATAAVAAVAAPSSFASAGLPAAPAHAVRHAQFPGLVFMINTRHGKEVTSRRSYPTCSTTKMNIYLTNAISEELNGNGVGNTMTINSNRTSDWDVTCPTGGMAFHPTGEPDHCIIEADTSGDSTLITSTNCTVARRVWIFSNGTGQSDWVSNYDDAGVYVNQATSGSSVRFTTGNYPNGAYSNWSAAPD